MPLNAGPDYRDYEDLNEVSSEAEKINEFIKILKRNNRPCYIEFRELYITDEEMFVINLKKTGFVQPAGHSTHYNTPFKLTDAGHIMLANYGTYLNYLDEVEQSQKREMMKDETWQMNTILTQLNTKPVGNCHYPDEILKATGLNGNTVTVICKRISKLSKKISF